MGLHGNRLVVPGGPGYVITPFPNGSGGYSGCSGRTRLSP